MASHITDRQIAKMKQRFLSLDEEGGSDISVGKLKTIMKDPGVDLSEDNINSLMGELDLDHNGTIDSCEFLILLSNRKDQNLKDVVHRAIILRAPIRKEFKKYDANGDGFITVKEFRGVMKKNKDMISDSQLEEMIKDAKKANGGKIDYDEFILVITNRLMMYNMYGAF